jgi:hypothetical protein
LISHRSFFSALSLLFFAPLRLCVIHAVWRLGVSLPFAVPALLANPADVTWP